MLVSCMQIINTGLKRLLISPAKKNMASSYFTVGDIAVPA